MFIEFVFGFKNEQNIPSAYPDLNAASWNVPMQLGGGYHYMQFDGKFINNIDEAQRILNNTSDQTTEQAANTIISNINQYNNLY